MDSVFLYDGRLEWLNFLPMNLNDTICIDCKCLIPYNSQIVNHTSSQILELKKVYPDKKILFYNVFEGVQKDVHYSINQIITNLVSYYNFKLSDFVILNGCYPNNYNVELYKKYIESSNFLKIKTFLVNSLELGFLKILLHESTWEGPKFKFLSNIEYNIAEKNKNFLLYIGKVSQNRIYLFHELHKLNLLDNSYYSCYFEKEKIDLINWESYPKYLKDSISFIKEFRVQFPIKLSANDTFDNIRMWGFNNNEKYHYTDTYFSIIPETHSVHQNQHPNQNHILIDQVFITEKTYRIIAGKAPFIMVGFTNTLQILRDAGYKTFHPFIDESYDTIENDEDRLKAIIQEIQRLCNFSKKEWIEWGKNIIPIIEHNQKVLFNISPKYIDLY